MGSGIELGVGYKEVGQRSKIKVLITESRKGERRKWEREGVVVKDDNNEINYSF